MKKIIFCAGLESLNTGVVEPNPNDLIERSV